MFPFLSFSQEARPQRFREIQTWVEFFHSMVLSNMDFLQTPLHVSISFLEDLYGRPCSLQQFVWPSKNVMCFHQLIHGLLYLCCREVNLAYEILLDFSLLSLLAS